MKSEYITKVSFFTSHKYLNDLINHIYLIGINSFEEQDNSVILYLKPEETSKIINNIAVSFKNGDLDISVEHIKNRNWNEEWQKSIEPIFIGKRLVV